MKVKILNFKVELQLRAPSDLLHCPGQQGAPLSVSSGTVAIELVPQHITGSGQWGRDAGPVGTDRLRHHRTAGLARAHQPPDPAHGAPGASDPRGRHVGVAVGESAGWPRGGGGGGGGLRGGNPRMHLQKHHTEAEHGQVNGESRAV